MKSGLKTSVKPSNKQKIKPAYIYAAWAIGISVVIGLIAFFYFGRFETAFAGSTYTTTTAGGDWATGTTWTGGSSPASWGSNTANINGNTTLTSTTTAINGFTAINLNGGKSFTSGTASSANDLSMQSVTFNVVNGNVTVYGNLTLNASTLTITAGSLTVTGTLTLTGGATVTSNSTGAINLGSFTTTGSGGTLDLNSGSLTVTNGISLNSGGVLDIASGVTASAASFTSSNNNTAILNNAGILTIPGDVNEGGIINNTGTMNVGGNIISSGSSSSIFTNSGTLNLSGSMTLPSSGKFKENPGGKAVVNGSINVGGNQNLIIGTSVAPPAYADLVVKQNLVQSGSGDVLFDKNSRVVIYGNVTDSGGGGTLFTINNGGEVYVNGNINYTGGGSTITNNNTVNPYGFYVNGTITNSGTTTTNEGNKTVLQTTNVPFYNWIAAQSGSPLPITLLNFKVNEVSSDGVNLTWSTASEENFDRFLVERSSDAKSFTKVGEVDGKGNSKALLNYSYTDKGPVTGKVYYRLKSLDLDGKFDYSPVVTAEAEGSEASKEFTIYPNPSNGESINFNMNFDTQEGDVIAVFDNAGAEIMHAPVSSLNGQIVFNQTLKPGIYIIKYSSSGFRKTMRMVVR